MTSEQSALLAADFDPSCFQEIDRHGRRIMPAGQSSLMFARFLNAVDALSCAVDIQQRFAKESVAQDSSALSPRVAIDHAKADAGINGTHDDEVEAMRSLVTLADPGGIRISRTVYDEVRFRIKLPYDTTRDPKQTATVCQEIRRNWDQLSLLAASSVGIDASAFRTQRSSSSISTLLTRSRSLIRRVGALLKVT